jgi:uncharacterized integral membrane protein (TIGR00698 family)
MDSPPRPRKAALDALPGLAVCLAIALVASGAAAAQHYFTGAVTLDAHVIAILIGCAIRTGLPVPASMEFGIGFAGKGLLDLGVAFLGASLSVQVLQSAAPLFVALVAVLVVLAVGFGYFIGRAFGLPAKLSILIACGNSICGNSAIATVAPLIGASARDVISAVAFTAILGIPLVIIMPAVAALLNVDPRQYGIFVGLTVYSVPQVLAAAIPAGVAATQIATLTKLIRILLLAPVAMICGILFNKDPSQQRALRFGLMPPWFIILFFAFASARSLEFLSEPVVTAMSLASNALTLVAMAALGLSADAKVLRRSGGQILGATLVSMAMLAALSALIASSS